MLPGFMNNEKRIASLILQSPDKKTETEVKEPTEMVGYDIATEEMMSAIKSGNKNAFRDALKSFMTLCYEEKEALEENTEMESIEE